jgi:hypothetical protein
MGDFDLHMCKNNEYRWGSDSNISQEEWDTPMYELVIKISK